METGDYCSFGILLSFHVGRDDNSVMSQVCKSDWDHEGKERE